MVNPGLAIVIGLMIVLILYVFRETLSLSWKKFAILAACIMTLNLAFPYLYKSLDSQYLFPVLFAAIILISAVTLLPEKKKYVPRVSVALGVEEIGEVISPNQAQLFNVNEQVAATLHHDFDLKETTKNMMMNDVGHKLIEDLENPPVQEEWLVLESRGQVTAAIDPLMVEEPSAFIQELQEEEIRSNIADLLTEEEVRRKIEDIQN